MLTGMLGSGSNLFIGFINQAFLVVIRQYLTGYLGGGLNNELAYFAPQFRQHAFMVCVSRFPRF